MNFLSETKKYLINGEKLNVSLHFNKNQINSIILTLSDSLFNEKRALDIFKEIYDIKIVIWQKIDDYFSGKFVHHSEFFNLILNNPKIFGTLTNFQKKTYIELCKTQKGDIITYKKLGLNIKSRGFQAIGNTMKMNKFPILIPCHRVISTSGLGGYMGCNDKSLNFNNSNSIGQLYQNIIEDNIEIQEPLKIKILLLNFEMGL